MNIGFTSFRAFPLFFSDLRPKLRGQGVYQCLLWAAMPITELCPRGWRDCNPVTFCQDGCFDVPTRWMRANAAWCQCATLAVRHVSSNGCWASKPTALMERYRHSEIVVLGFDNLFLDSLDILGNWQRTYTAVICWCPFRSDPVLWDIVCWLPWWYGKTWSWKNML